ncbi:MAG: glycosyltransferase family 2 protein [Oscillospiraceae bacterium]|jgi:cellulose synthase/poly-beta-1,6-N-acetylglucosamine synthase-like glycosyltransferase|nr:glycosyltransferase family 2 protein [Oscillospiraceae bacterium]
MDIFVYVNYVISIIFIVCYSYQAILFVFVSLVRRAKPLPDAPYRRYAVLVCARNESAVVRNLIESIQAQNYPQELIDTYVVADNCTDNTAETARAAGAIVFERDNTSAKGKGHALTFLLNAITETHPDWPYDGYFIIDADNLLDENYIREMNKAFTGKYRILTSYRNSKNYGDNWISAGHSLWYLREARYLNDARFTLRSSCAVSGTGFLVHRDVFRDNGGWTCHLLTEDIEFTVSEILKGETIGYCRTAILYDEQPIKFEQSWHQRMRWTKGSMQVLAKYGTGLFTGFFKKGRFSCFDMLMNLFPVALLSCICLVSNTIGIICGIAEGDGLVIVLFSLGELAMNCYFTCFAMGLITCVTEWRQIHCGVLKKIFHTLTFPLYMLTFIPIFLTALVKKDVTWVPIAHTRSKRLKDVRTV